MWIDAVLTQADTHLPEMKKYQREFARVFVLSQWARIMKNMGGIYLDRRNYEYIRASGEVSIFMIPKECHSAVENIADDIVYTFVN